MRCQGEDSTLPFGGFRVLVAVSAFQLGTFEDVSASVSRTSTWVDVGMCIRL